ncbi:hypothetical protein AAY473_002299, partial [Plecturocebus cupreus]
MRPQHFGRLKWADHLKSGVQDQPGQHEMGFHHVGQAGLKLLISGDSLALASESAEITDCVGYSESLVFPDECEDQLVNSQ